MLESWASNLSIRGSAIGDEPGSDTKLLREFVMNLVTRPLGRIGAESCFLFLSILLIWGN
jgi:hypothetical protein